MTYSDTGVPLGTTELIRSGLNQRQELIRDRSTHRYYRTKSETEQNLIKYRSTRRYYRTFSDTGVPIGTTELNQRQEYL